MFDKTDKVSLAFEMTIGTGRVECPSIRDDYWHSTP